MIFIALTLLFLLPEAPANLWAQDLAVVGHPGIPDENLSKAVVLDYFTGDRRKWSDDQPVVPLDLQEPEDVRKNFYKTLGKSSSRMRSIWMKRKLSGEGEPPEPVESEAQLLEKVASTPGSIGFVRRDSVHGSVKVLAVL
jgi:ABC-type phosphate transport system substrate-binding protein